MMTRPLLVFALVLLCAAHSAELRASTESNEAHTQRRADDLDKDEDLPEFSHFHLPGLDSSPTFHLSPLNGPPLPRPPVFDNSMPSFPMHHSLPAASGRQYNHPKGPPRHKIESEVTSAEDGCEFSLDGEDFDLSPLRLKSGQQEYMTEDMARNVYKLNICGSATTPASDCQRSNGMICQYLGTQKTELEGVIARWDATPPPVWSFIDETRPEAGVKLDIANGDDCDVRGIKKTREAILFFPCDPSAGKIGTIAVQETSTCTYVLTIPTELSCLGRGGLSHGWVFIIFLIFGTAIYIGGGLLWNRMRGGKEGLDAFPNIDFWRELPSLVKDGIAFTRDTIASKCGGDGVEEI